MSKKPSDGVIFFADIADSTRLYETYGDTIAKHIIDTCLQLLGRVTNEYKGTPIKTIGDAIMCMFTNVDYAYLASCAMHELVNSHQELKKFKIQIKIGFHSGPVIRDNHDVFGDTVNVASRISSLANATKTLITDSAVEQLSAHFKTNIRYYDQVSIKGKTTPIQIWEILWKTHDDDMTIMVCSTPPAKSNSPILRLSYKDKSYQITQESPTLVIGRSTQADIYINSTAVSRTHLLIEYSSGKFKLSDKSTNGSYIKVKGGKPLFLKNEQVFLLGQGEISVGSAWGNDENHLVKYCELTI